MNAQHIGTDGQDLRVYRTSEDRLASELKVSMNYTGASQIWTAYDIHFDEKLADCHGVYGFNLNTIVVTGENVTFTADPEAYYNPGSGRITHYQLYFLTLEVAKKALLNIEDNSTIAVKDVVNNGEIHVGSGSSLYYSKNRFEVGEKYSGGHNVI